MQHDTTAPTTTYNMIQQHTTRWSNGRNFFFTTNVARCMKSWDRLTRALVSYKKRVYNFLNLLSIVYSSVEFCFSQSLIVLLIFLGEILKMLSYKLQKRSIILKVLKRSGPS